MYRTQNPYLSKYLALGSVTDFDLLPESSILKFLPRKFFFFNQTSLGLTFLQPGNKLQPFSGQKHQLFKYPQNSLAWK